MKKLILETYAINYLYMFFKFKLNSIILVNVRSFFFTFKRATLHDLNNFAQAKLWKKLCVTY